MQCGTGLGAVASLWDYRHSHGGESKAYLVTGSFNSSKGHTKWKDKRKVLNAPVKQRWDLREFTCFKGPCLPKPRANKAKDQSERPIWGAVELHCCKQGAIPKLVLHGATTGKTQSIYGRIQMLMTLSENGKSRSRGSCYKPSKLFIRANRCISGSVDEWRFNPHRNTKILCHSH